MYNTNALKNSVKIVERILGDDSNKYYLQVIAAQTMSLFMGLSCRYPLSFLPKSSFDIPNILVHLLQIFLPQPNIVNDGSLKIGDGEVLLRLKKESNSEEVNQNIIFKSYLAYLCQSMLKGMILYIGLIILFL